MLSRPVSYRITARNNRILTESPAETVPLICLLFCEYSLWALAIEVNSLAILSKRVQRFEGR